MTGIVSTLADELALGHLGLAGGACAALMAFVLGAMTTTISVNFARRHQLRSLYAIPLFLESVLLLGFGLLGGVLAGYTALVVPATVLVLCFLMGLQNAVITKVSKAEIRTTHVTGLVTDIGIELGRFIYHNRSDLGEPVRANRERLGVHVLLFSCFAVGGLLGALGFKTIGYFAIFPLAAVLAILAMKPIATDLTSAA